MILYPIRFFGLMLAFLVSGCNPDQTRHAITIEKGGFIDFFDDSDELSKEWAEDKSILEKVANEGRCEEYWNILWPWAKRGNKEAMDSLFLLLMPPPHMDRICSPGNSCDLVSSLRDAVVFAVHTSDHQKDEVYVGVANHLYETFGFRQTERGRNFIECLDKKSSRNCAAVAVYERLVPSFEEYASHIDALIAQGWKSTCENKAQNK